MHDIPKQILADRKPVDPDLPVTFTAHAIDRFSIRHISDWAMNGKYDEGIYSYMMDLFMGSFDRKTVLKTGKVMSGAVTFVVAVKHEDKEKYVVTTVL